MVSAAQAAVNDYEFNPYSGRMDAVRSSGTLPSGSTQYIWNTQTEQSAHFYVSSGTITGRLMFDTDQDTYFDLIGDDLFLYVNGSLRQTWTTETADEYVLLESGDFLLLETGDKLLLE